MFLIRFLIYYDFLTIVCYYQMPVANKSSSSDIGMTLSFLSPANLANSLDDNSVEPFLQVLPTNVVYILVLCHHINNSTNNVHKKYV